MPTLVLADPNHIFQLPKLYFGCLFFQFNASMANKEGDENIRENSEEKKDRGKKTT